MHEPHHGVQLFDTPESRAEAVFEFVRDGLLAGDAVLVVATRRHGEAIARRCRENNIDVDAACAAGWLTILDADETLARFMRYDRPEWPLFEATAGAIVRQLSANGARLRIYGEMVDVLTRANQFDAAEQLEQFWNRLRARETFTLFCGYSAEHFGNPRDRDSLRRICGQHTHVHAHPRDVLGNFLLKT